MTMAKKRASSVIHVFKLLGFIATTILSGAIHAQAPIEDRDMFFDADGLIVHQRPDGSLDGGDTAQREGWYWFGVWLRANTPGLEPWTYKRKLTFDQVLALLEPNRDGVFYRHPKQPQFNKPFDKEYGFSRDQMVPLVAAMGVWGKQDELRRLWNALPEDLVSKHSFNGNWRNFLGQDGPNCGEILQRGCDATRDCSLQADNRDCSLAVDNRDCSLQVDSRDCSLQVDDRDCSLNVDSTDCSLKVDNRNCEGLFKIFCEGQKAAANAAFAAEKFACEAGKAAANADYARLKGVCEAAKSAQNVGYAAAKAACEVSKTTQNQLYVTQKATCETAKAGQNALYASQKATCESGKATQNALYAADKAACETFKTGGKFACEFDKQRDYQTCHVTNVFSGDIIGPSAINLFLRALNEHPLAPLTSLSSGTLIQGGVAGEAELLVNSHLRVGKSHDDLDDVGDDLNHIVMLLLARIRFATPVSDEAMRVYVSQRQYSYGSYLGTYYADHPNDANDMDALVKAGAKAGWKPDVSPPYGAVRWYHRPSSGANPRLARMYAPIIEAYLRPQ